MNDLSTQTVDTQAAIPMLSNPSQLMKELLAVDFLLTTTKQWAMST